MSSKYHLSPGSGNPAICHASIRGCPLGANDTDHYDNPDLAREAFEKKNYKNLFAVQKRMTPQRRNEELYKDKALEFQARLDNIQANGRTKISDDDDYNSIEELNEALGHALKGDFNHDDIDSVMESVSSTIQQMKNRIPSSHISALNIGRSLEKTTPEDFSNEFEAQSIIYKLDKQIETLELHNDLKNPYEADENYVKMQAPKGESKQKSAAPAPITSAGGAGGAIPPSNTTSAAAPDPDNNDANKAKDAKITSNTSQTPPKPERKPSGTLQLSRNNGEKINGYLNDYRKSMGIEGKNIDVNSYKTHAQINSAIVNAMRMTVNEAHRKGNITAYEKLQFERKIDRASNFKANNKENVEKFNTVALRVANELSDKTQAGKNHRIQAAKKAAEVSEGRRIGYNDKNISSLTGSTPKERYDFIKKHSGSHYVSGMYSGNYYNTYETSKGVITLDHSGRESVTFKVNGKHFIMKYDQRGELQPAKEYKPW